MSNLLQPLGGVFQQTARVRTGGPEPPFRVTIVTSGDLRQLRNFPAAKYNHHEVNGAGTAPEARDSEFLATAEGLERYCASLYRSTGIIHASANELGAGALDLDEIPRCSETELRHPRCPLRAPDKGAPIPWVLGLSLLDGRRVYLPAVMVYLDPDFATGASRFSIPISTGCATHISYERALLSALLEVVERDAISLLWLQKLPLPRLEVDCVPASLSAAWDCYQRASADVEYIFFDATTDLGIPIVYGIQLAPADERLTTIVSCSSALDAATAVGKVIRDLAAMRVAFRNPSPVPEDFDEFTDISHGALYMGHRARLGSFDFLLRTPSTRSLNQMPAAGDAGLETVLANLRRCNLKSYAVDLTTDEAARAGLCVVRALIPGLQPLSFRYRARFLGHPRLYDAPRRMGYRVFAEEDLNAWPQPFA